jgi:hypothetical protein
MANSAEIEEDELLDLCEEEEEEDGSDESDDEGRRLEKQKDEDVFKSFIKGLFDGNGSGSECDLSMANTEDEDEVSKLLMIYLAFMIYHNRSIVLSESLHLLVPAMVHVIRLP